MPSLSFYICGNSGEPSENNPITVAREEKTIKILLHFLKEPINRDSLSDYLSQSQVEMIPNLIRLGLLKEQKGTISLNFPILTLNDYEVLDDALTIITTELVEAFQHKWERISKLVSEMRNASPISIEEALYNIVGCVIIDWLALQWLTKEGIIFFAKDQPNGTKYLLQGSTEDAFERAYSRFCYGTTMGTEEWRYTVFGQSHKKRWAPPEVEMHISSTIMNHLDAPGNLTSSTASYAQVAMNHTLHHVAEVLTSDKPSIHALTSLLHCSEYGSRIIESYLKEVGVIDVDSDGNWIPRILILQASDKNILEEIAEISRGIIISSLSKSLDSLHLVYSNTTPGKHGVPIEETLTDLWHDIFSKAIVLFIEKGQMKTGQKDSECGWSNFIWSSNCFNFSI